MESLEDKSLWKNRNFVLLLSGQFVSWIGTEFSSITIPLIVLSITGSPQQAGMIAGARGLSYILLAIPAGALIDRLDRRKVMIIANIGGGLALGSIVVGLLLNKLTIPYLYVASLLEGGFFVFANLSRFAAVQQIVPKPQLGSALGKISVSDYISLLLGPALGGILYQAVGALLTILLDSITYFINALSIFFINVSLKVEREKPDHIYKEIQEGIKWLWNEKTIRFLCLLTSGSHLVVSSVYLLIIIIARQNHAPAAMIGIILGIGAGGGILGSLIAEKVSSRFKFHSILRTTTALSFLTFLLYFFTFNNILLILATFLFNLVTPIYEITSSTYSAKVIPNEIRGRVSSLTRIAVLSAYSFGLFAMGTMLELYGVNTSIAVSAGVLFLLATITHFSRSLKNAKPA